MTVKRRIGFVVREDDHSNGSRDSDRRILDAVLDRLRGAGCQTRAIWQAPGSLDVAELAGLDLVLSMARGVDALNALAAHAAGVPSINDAVATLDTLRERLYPALASLGIATPATRLVNLERPIGLALPYWLKRRDYHRVQPEDVALVRTDAEHRAAVEHFGRQGQSHAFAQSHVAGDLIKFYAVFDRPAGRVAFLDTREPAPARVVDQLDQLSSTLALGLGLDVFGGDVLVAEGRLFVVDVNAWPSFATCRERAADVIAACALGRLSPAGAPVPRVRRARAR